MKQGYKPTYTDRRDLDLLKSFGATQFDTTSLPRTYLVDAGLDMPDQNADGFPYACTGYTSASLCEDEDGVMYDPIDTYVNTPPGDSGGRALRDSVAVLMSRGPRKKDGTFGPKRAKYYNIRTTGFLDWFDAIRVGLYVVKSEKRAASAGIPWFPQFEQIGADGILPTEIIYDWKLASGHNAKLDGWTDTNSKGQPIRTGELFLRVKSWQGKNYGDNGWCYMPRALANALLSMDYTEVLTVTKLQPTTPQTVDLTLIESIVSFIVNLLSQKKTL